MRYDVAILGGGAAGLMCAIEAGKRGRRTVVLEHNAQIGRKILISGGGRCNFTNLHTTAANFLSANPHFAKSALARYTEDGRLKMDNNGAEQALRPIVLGRKNYLFAGSEAAAHRTAILCSLVQTCKHLQINSFVYLRDVIDRVSTHPERLVLELAPREWKRFRQDSVAQAAA